LHKSSENYLKLSISLFITVGAGNLHAHEFWLEPQSYHVKPDASVSIDLKSGEGFTGITYPWIPKRVLNTGPITDATVIHANAGRAPALRAIANTSGLTALYYQSNPSKLSHEMPGSLNIIPGIQKLYYRQATSAAETSFPEKCLMSGLR